MKRNYKIKITLLVILILKISISEKAHPVNSMLMPGDTITWTGVVDTNWHEIGNWDPMIIPDFGIDSGHHVIIPVVASGNYPIVSNDAGARSLVLHFGASLKVEIGSNLLVVGSAGDGFLNYGYLFNHGDLRIDSSFNDGLLNFPDAEIENTGSIVIIEGQGKRLLNWGSIWSSGTVEVLDGLDTNMINYPGGMIENDNGSFTVFGGNSTRLVNYGRILTDGTFSIGGSAAGKGLINKTGGYIDHASGTFSVSGGHDVRVVNYDTIKSSGFFSIGGAAMGEGFINHENAFFENKGGFSVSGGSGTQVDNFGSIISSASFSAAGIPMGPLILNRSGADFFHNGPDLSFSSTGGDMLQNNGKMELMSGLNLSNASGSGLINTDSLVIHSPSGLSISNLSGYAIDNHHVIISHGPIAVFSIGNFSTSVLTNREGAQILQYGTQNTLNIHNTSGSYGLHNQGELFVEGSLQIQGFYCFTCPSPFLNDTMGVVNIVRDLTVTNIGSSEIGNNGAVVNFNHFELGDSSNITINNSSGVGIFNAADFITGEGCQLMIRQTANGSIFNAEGAYFLNRCDSEFRNSGSVLITNQGTYLHKEGSLDLSNCSLAVNNQSYMEIDVPISQVSSMSTIFQNSDTLILGAKVVFSPITWINRIFENSAGAYLYSDAQLSVQHFDRYLNNSGKAVLGPSSSFTGEHLSVVVSNSDTLINMGHLEARQFFGPMISTSGYLHNSGTINSSFHGQSIESLGGHITNAGLMHFDSIGSYGMSLSANHSFLNTEDGVIEMNYTMNSSLNNHSGVFENRGSITIARQDTSSTGISNLADFYNFGSIDIGENANIGNDGLTNSSSGYFLNEGSLSIGGSGIIHNHGISNEGIFVNNYCSRLDLFASLNNQDSFENRGIIEISTDSTHFNSGIFNNYGELFFDPPGSIPNVIQSMAEEIVFVNANATGGNSGTSWENAFTDLQDALNLCTNVTQIWVAAGTYYPSDSSGLTPINPRNATFHLKNGVAMYGGFEGTEDPLTFDLGDRDFVTNETILSGEIGDPSSIADNVHHVVIAGLGITSTSVIDGFTIRAGNAIGAGAGSFGRGGGMLIRQGASPVIANCNIRENSAAGGAGMSIESNSSPIISNCNFIDNTSTGGGAGMIIGFGSSPSINNCTFLGNSSGDFGGAISIFSPGSNPIIKNSSFKNNTSTGLGGGISSISAANPQIINCVFQGNSSARGGGLSNDNSSPVIINCTFSGNSASISGGGIQNVNNSSPAITNSIIWNNTANGSAATASASVFNGGSSNPTFSYSLIANSGGSGSWNGDIGADNGNNIESDPLFVQDVDLDSIPTTAGNLRLQACSPAIDRGNNDALTASDSLDLDGNDRIFGGTVDMGAYEFQGLVEPCECIDDQVLYVDHSNTSGVEDGYSWSTAFRDLQDALSLACGCGDTLEIWVAEGTYYPTQDSLDRNATFQLCNNVALYGGFTGNETMLSERDWETNETTLSGDINQSNDLSGNSYTVVTGSGTDETAIIDGFTITGGNADATSGSPPDPNRSGGGIYNNGGSPTIINSTISGNEAGIFGGGIFNSISSPTITNSTISGNSAGSDGGGIYNIINSSPTITNSTISGNEAGEWGGGIYNW
ncbi:MAG: hypothetical protein EA409_00485, partial [Saprospirales bacterium]